MFRKTRHDCPQMQASPWPCIPAWKFIRDALKAFQCPWEVQDVSYPPLLSEMRNPELNWAHYDCRYEIIGAISWGLHVAAIWKLASLALYKNICLNATCAWATSATLVDSIWYDQGGFKIQDRFPKMHHFGALKLKEYMSVCLLEHFWI